jgi:glycosyltransferase involved in cell wall biosynthesis
MAETKEIESLELLPSISLILPVFNGEDYLMQCLDSIAKQCYTNLELIIINDGSTDNSLQILENYPLKKTLITQENKGVYTARNLGISLATSEFISFFDADDIMAEGNLIALSSYLVSNPNCLIVKGKMQRFSWKNEVWLNSGEPHVEDFCLSLALFRKGVFKKVGLFAEEMRLGADADWHLRSQELGINVAILDHLAIYYRMHPNNISNFTEEAKKARLEVIRRKLQRSKL